MIRVALLAMDSRAEILDHLKWSGGGALVGFVVGAIFGRYGWRGN